MPTVLSIYGLKILAEAESLYQNLGLTVDARNLWQELKTDRDAPTETLTNILAKLSQNKKFEFLGAFNPSAQRRNQSEQMSLAILAIDKLSPPGKTVDDLDAVGQVVTQLLARVSDSTGQRGGEYHTPQTLNDLSATVILKGLSKEVDSVYDPACGIGGSLVAISRVLAEKSRAVHYFGQDINAESLFVATWHLLLYGLINFKLARGDTLSHPDFVDGERVQQFDVVISTPPFNLTARGDLGGRDPYQRNRFGEVRGKRADYAFLQHIIASVKPEGRAAVHLASGTLFRSGFEQDIRENIVHADLIDACISLPGNVFSTTSIPVALLTFKMTKPDNERGKIFFIDASEASDAKSRDNPLTKGLSSRIAETYSLREDTEGFSRLATLEEVKQNNYNLLPQHYVPKEKVKYPSAKELDSEVAEKDAQLASARDSFDTALSKLEA